MQSRRDALRLFAITPAALPALALTPQQDKEVDSQPGHPHSATSAPVTPLAQYAVFQLAESQTIEAMTERIIPRSDTPGAKDAGVTHLIENSCASSPDLISTYRAGIADLNAISIRAYGSDFAALTDEQQIAVLTPISLEPDTALNKFFTLVKEMTIDAYYKTEAGLRIELGWHANTYLASFPGCNHPEHQA
jgi:hypothetical protein